MDKKTKLYWIAEVETVGASTADMQFSRTVVGFEI